MWSRGRHPANSPLACLPQTRSSSSFAPKVRVFRRGNASSFFSYGYRYRVRDYSGYGVGATNVTLAVAGVGAAVRCDPILTYANFSDPYQWSWGRVSRWVWPACRAWLA
jgi:hypothetical protein